MDTIVLPKGAVVKFLGIPLRLSGDTETLGLAVNFTSSNSPLAGSGYAGDPRIDRAEVGDERRSRIVINRLEPIG